MVQFLKNMVWAILLLIYMPIACLQLAEERQRYGKLQQASDSELDTLRQQHHVLQQQLELTTRKLENLTDIERQLSTRKPAGNFSPDTPHESEKPAPSTDEVTPDEP